MVQCNSNPSLTLEIIDVARRVYSGLSISARGAVNSRLIIVNLPWYFLIVRSANKKIIITNLVTKTWISNTQRQV